MQFLYNSFIQNPVRILKMSRPRIVFMQRDPHINLNVPTIQMIIQYLNTNQLKRLHLLLR